MVTIIAVTPLVTSIVTPTATLRVISLMHATDPIDTLSPEKPKLILMCISSCS